MSKKIVIIVGTRPEAIKMAPVYRALRQSESLTPVLVSTGQHRRMLDQALSVFDLKPEVDLELMEPGQSLSGLAAKVISRTADVLRELAPSAVLVQGDTTTAMAAGIASFYSRVPVGHIEAGLRTYNLNSPWPEEMNRRLIDPMARWCFAPTDHSRDNLLSERIDPAIVHVTGNTVIDALLWTRDKLKKQGVEATAVADRLGIPPAFAERYFGDSGDPWILVTGHRRESFGGGFERICEAIDRLTREYPQLGVLYPVHLNPQVQEPVMRLLGNNKRIALISPAGYEDFIWLLDRCRFALSDSGGVQEEAPSLGKPVLVMRETTERPEGVEAGTCTLVGTAPDTIHREADRLLGDADEYTRRCALQNPYGDGTAGIAIRQILEDSL